MKVVSARFGHGVDYTAGRLAQFRRIVAGSYLIFLDGIKAVDIRQCGAAFLLGKEGLIVVGSIDVAAVVES